MLEITGVLPTYNRAGLIDRAIRSMLNQSLPLVEIIVVDDGSEDGTREIVKRYGNPVRYVFQQNAGGAAARNRGVELARTSWVAFLDSDDFWNVDHLERIKRAMTHTSGSADLYFDDTTHLTGHDSLSRWELAGFAVGGQYSLREDGTGWMMMERQPVMLQASIIKRCRFLEIGGFWEELRTAHDTHFFLRLGIGRPVCAVAGVGAVQTEDEVPANRLTIRTGRVKLSRWINTARLNRDILDRYPHVGPTYQALLRRRVCEARWRASRMYWDERNIIRSLGEAWQAFQYDPRMFIRKFSPFRIIELDAQRKKLKPEAEVNE